MQCIIEEDEHIFDICWHLDKDFLKQEFLLIIQNIFSAC